MTDLFSDQRLALWTLLLAAAFISSVSAGNELILYISFSLSLSISLSLTIEKCWPLNHRRPVNSAANGSFVSLHPRPDDEQ